jgi:hypothetical protein
MPSITTRAVFNYLYPSAFTPFDWAQDRLRQAQGERKNYYVGEIPLVLSLSKHERHMSLGQPIRNLF